MSGVYVCGCIGSSITVFIISYMYVHACVHCMMAVEGNIYAFVNESLTSKENLLQLLL